MALEKEWDDLMKNLCAGSFDRYRAAYLIERLNAIDKFLMDQGKF